MGPFNEFLLFERFFLRRDYLDRSKDLEILSSKKNSQKDSFKGVIYSIGARRGIFQVFFEGGKVSFEFWSLLKFLGILFSCAFWGFFFFFLTSWYLSEFFFNEFSLLFFCVGIFIMSFITYIKFFFIFRYLLFFSNFCIWFYFLFAFIWFYFYFFYYLLISF